MYSTAVSYYSPLTAKLSYAEKMNVFALLSSRIKFEMMVRGNGME